jgi:hypothetical protein
MSSPSNDLIELRPCGGIASRAGYSFGSVNRDDGGVIHLLVNPDGDCIAKFSEPEKTIAKAKGLSGGEAEAVDGFAKLVLRWD